MFFRMSLLSRNLPPPKEVEFQELSNNMQIEAITLNIEFEMLKNRLFKV